SGCVTRRHVPYGVLTTLRGIALTAAVVALPHPVVSIHAAADVLPSPTPSPTDTPTPSPIPDPTGTLLPAPSATPTPTPVLSVAPPPAAPPPPASGTPKPAQVSRALVLLA